LFVLLILRNYYKPYSKGREKVYYVALLIFSQGG